MYIILSIVVEIRSLFSQINTIEKRIIFIIQSAMQVKQQAV